MGYATERLRWSSSRSQSSGYSPGHDASMRRFNSVLDRFERGVAQVVTVEDLLTASVDDFALLVHHLVVLEDVLADLEVAVFDGALSPFDRLRHHLRFERHVVGEGAIHHPVHGAGREQSHELVFERQVEPARAGVALTTAATTELVVDTSALVTLGAEHVETAQRTNVVALFLALDGKALHQLLVALGSLSAWGPRRAARPRPSPRGCRRGGCRRRGRPCWWRRSRIRPTGRGTMWASRSCCFAFSTACGMPRLSRRRERASRTSPPRWCRREPAGLPRSARRCRRPRRRTSRLRSCR